MAKGKGDGVGVNAVFSREVLARIDVVRAKIGTSRAGFLRGAAIERLEREERAQAKRDA